MTPVAVLFVLMGRQFAVPDLSVEARCAIVEAVLGARAKQGRNLSAKPNVVDLSFPEIDFVRLSTRWASGRTVTTARWDMGRDLVDVFSKAESCGNDIYALEHAVPPDKKGHVGDRTGASDYVVEITLKRPSWRKADEFVFEERLDLSLHAQPTKCCYGVPGLRYAGTVDKTRDGGWNAKVKTAIFAF